MFLDETTRHIEGAPQAKISQHDHDRDNMKVIPMKVQFQFIVAKSCGHTATCLMQECAFGHKTSMAFPSENSIFAAKVTWFHF